MQTYTSKNTSVNTTVLPAIYNRIKWNLIEETFAKDKYVLFDYGCGRKIEHLRKFMVSKGWEWVGYDPNCPQNLSEFIQFDKKLKECYNDPRTQAVIITSNVLNVIDDEATIGRTLDYCAQDSRLIYFHKIYLGDKTGIPRVTKKDCFQWNKPATFYLSSDFDIVKSREYITHQLYARFL